MNNIKHYISLLNFQANRYKKDVESFITGLDAPILTTLTLIIQDPRNSAINHWIHELSNWIDDINDLKMKNGKHLESSQYFKLIYLDYLEDGKIHPSRIITKTNNKEGTDIYKYSIQFNESLISILKEICDLLSKGHAEYSVVKSLLNERK